MIEEDGMPEDFPRTESFQDCNGRAREFDFDLHVTDGGYFLRAVERGRGDGGYEIRAHAETSPYLALGRIRGKVRRALAVRYLTDEGGSLGLSHDVARGRISYGGVVVDGQFIPFEQFAEMMQVYEGWDFSPQITSGYESE